MSVLYCHIPNFLLGLAYRHAPNLSDRPLALLGDDGRVWARSAQASQAGVQEQMTARQAQMRCPDIVLRAFDVATCRAEQGVFAELLTEWQLPVEEVGWGEAYLDLHTLAKEAKQVTPLAGELGRHIRQHMGQALQPSLGWDSGKFTARVAAHTTAAGRLKLVSRSEEVTFLAPLPTTLLPLAAPVLQQLHWLGIHTLGQFAALPAQAVWQRWGQPGKLAHAWAKGQDDRPVRSTVRPTTPPLRIDLDPPTALLTLVVAAVLTALRPTLQRLAEQMEGVRQLRLTLAFVEGSKRQVELCLVTPLCHEKPLEALLTAQLQALPWPGEMAWVEIAHLDIGELRAQQLSLFPELDASGGDPAPTWLQRLYHRYGDIFCKAALSDAQHPVAERRFVYHAWLADQA